MEADEKWYFTKEQLASTPSRKYGYDSDRELSSRQQAANFIQDMGQRLQVTQLCINTAIVYMHRFYVFHSFTNFHRNAIAAAALFLAAKVEEQPRKLEHVIKVAQMCLHRDTPPLDTKSEQYLEQAQDLVMNENVLLQTLGFDVAIDHPHTHVVRCCHLVKASKDLAQTSYFMASNRTCIQLVLARVEKEEQPILGRCLHLTTMCLQYKPTVVACFCIHLACKWSNWEIPLSNEKKSWFWYVDKSVTQELLEQLTDEFLRIFDKCPSRLKRKISANQNMSGYHIGVNELNQKRLPGSGVDMGQHGVSFQQPVNRGRPSNEDKKKLEGCMLPPPPPPVVRPPLPPVPADFRKPPPPPHSAPRDPNYGGSMYHMGASTSQANSTHQATAAGSQFMYPPPFPAHNTNGPTGPSGRMPAPVPKHVVRSEAIFPPPKRSTSHSSAGVPSRQIKQEPQSPIQQPLKTPHTLSHHMPRNGTHMTENPAQPTIKHENVQGKYSAPLEKRSTNHQKSHTKSSYSSSRSNMPNTVNWPSSNDISGRNLTSETKHIKTEPKSEAFSQSSSYQSKTVPTKTMTSVTKPATSPQFSSPIKQTFSPPVSFSSHSVKPPRTPPFSPPAASHQIKQSKSPPPSPPKKQPSGPSTHALYQQRAPFSPPKKRPFTPPVSPPPVKPYTPPYSPSKKHPMSPPFSSAKKKMTSPPFSPPGTGKRSMSVVHSPPSVSSSKSQINSSSHVSQKVSSKPSSIFSPDKITPPPSQSPPRESKTSVSPLIISSLTPNKSGRNRTHSSSSEPELIPVMPKLEDISGFENIAKGLTAIRLPGKISGPTLQSKEKKKAASAPTAAKEVKPLIVSPPKLPDVVDSRHVNEKQPVDSSDASGSSKREHKKKKKHKEHREHKEHKDKDRDKEKKKDKHKEKHKEKEKDREKDKHRSDPAPIKITIPKDKIHKMSLIQEKIVHNSSQSDQNASLKIKIPKDKLMGHQVEQPGGLKIKISKEALLSTHSSVPSSRSASASGSSSKKRERSSGKEEKHSHSNKHAKMAKTNGDYRSIE